MYGSSCGVQFGNKEGLTSSSNKFRFWAFLLGLIFVSIFFFGYAFKVIKDDQKTHAYQVDWREVVSGPHYEGPTTFFITKAGRAGFVAFCSKEQAHAYLGMRKPVNVAVRLVEPKGVPNSERFFVVTELKEVR